MKNRYESFCVGAYSFIATLIGCTLCVFAVFLLGIRIAQVDGNSMYPGLLSGEKVIVSGVFYEPDYGDIVAIGRADSENGSLIKRIVGLPGDEINIDFNSHIVTVNGYIVPENYEVNAALSEKGDLTYPVHVPENCVFVLGDNRDDSLDSRFSEIGFIQLDEIVGKAVCRIYPFGNFSIYK